MGGVRGAVLTLGLVGCQATMAVPLPDFPEGTLAVTVARSGEDGSEVWAARWPEEGLAFFGEGALELAAWRCDLEHLGLMPGTQVLRSEAWTTDLLPDPAARYRSRREGDEVAPWTEAEALEAEVWRRLPVDNVNRCLAGRARLSAHPVLFTEDRRRPTFAVRIDRDHILVGARRAAPNDGTWGFMVARDGTYRTYDLGSPSKVAAFSADDGELWLLDALGRLTRGPLEGPRVEVAPPQPQIAPIAWASMDGARGGAPFELYVSTSSNTQGAGRRFARFDGTRWSVLGARDFDLLFIPAVAWLGPGQAIGIGAGRLNQETIRYDRGETKFDLLPGSTAGAATVRNVRRLGPIVGRDDGELDIFKDGRWEPLGGVRDTYYTRSLAPLGDGLVFATGTEINFFEYRYGQYHPGLGTCPLEELTEYAAGIMTAFGDGAVLAATLADFDAPAEVVILSVDSPPNACGTPALLDN